MHIDQIEDDISDDALEAAGATEVARWTFICTGIQCNSVFEMKSPVAHDATRYAERVGNRVPS